MGSPSPSLRHSPIRPVLLFDWGKSAEETFLFINVSLNWLVISTASLPREHGYQLSSPAKRAVKS